MTGFTVHARASMSRTHDPEFSTQDFDDTTNKLIVELHLEAAVVCEKMSNIHTYIACLKTWVSPKDFLTIVSSVGLPLTTISIVDPAQTAKFDSNVDNLRIRDHMLEPHRSRCHRKFCARTSSVITSSSYFLTCSVSCPRNTFQSVYFLSKHDLYFLLVISLLFHFLLNK